MIFENSKLTMMMDDWNMKELSITENWNTNLRLTVTAVQFEAGKQNPFTIKFYLIKNASDEAFFIAQFILL